MIFSVFPTISSTFPETSSRDSAIFEKISSKAFENSAACLLTPPGRRERLPFMQVNMNKIRFWFWSGNGLGEPNEFGRDRVAGPMPHGNGCIPASF